jgi:type II secretory pathway component GspD/PulD (secretin)
MQTAFGTSRTLLGGLCRRLTIHLHVLLTVVLLAGCWPEPPTPLPLLVRPDVPPQSISVDFPDSDIREMLEAVGSHFHLKVDLPRTLNGRTSLKLREVTWRQIFQVVLSPVGYDFYEENGTVIVRTKEEITSLPPVTKTVTLRHLPPHEASAYLTRVFRGKVSFTPAESSVTYHATRKMQREVDDEIHRIDSTKTVLNRFPKTPRLPKELPALTPTSRQPWERASNSDEFTTQIFLFEHIDAELAAPHIKTVAANKNARVVFDIRSNALVVIAIESRMPHVEAVVAYLDDMRWYEAESPVE